MPTNTYDVNVSPDKRTIFVHDENKIAEAIMEQLKQQLEPSRSTFSVNPLMTSTPGAEPMPDYDVTSTRIKEDRTLVDSPVVERVVPTTSSNTSLVDTFKNRVPSISNHMNSSSRVSSANKSLGLSRPFSSMNESSSKRAAPLTSSLLKYLTKRPKTNENDDHVEEIVAVDEDQMEIDEPDTYSDEAEMEVDLHDTDTKVYTGITSTRGLWNTFGRKIQTSMNLDDIKPLAITQTASEDEDFIEASTFVDASIKNTEDHEKATAALSRVISKPDFAAMKVLGQFNLGFIITSLNDKDIYIIDQHASDEKYNFETLQQTTRMETQALYSPQVLELTASEEHVVMDNLEIFKANGFGVQVYPDNEPTKRIQVISHPVSKNTMFDKKGKFVIPSVM